MSKTMRFVDVEIGFTDKKSITGYSSVHTVNKILFVGDYETDDYVKDPTFIRHIADAFFYNRLIGFSGKQRTLKINKIIEDHHFEVISVNIDESEIIGKTQY